MERQVLSQPQSQENVWLPLALCRLCAVSHGLRLSSGVSVDENNIFSSIHLYVFL